MRNHQFTELIIKDVNYSSEQQARQLVLEGLKEHFGYLDPTRNPDLDHIVDHYLSKGVVFLTGFVGDELVCTGALVPLMHQREESSGYPSRRNIGAKDMLCS